MGGKSSNFLCSLFLHQTRGGRIYESTYVKQPSTLRLAYRLVLLEEDSAVEGEVVPVPEHHSSVVIILECHYNIF